GGGDITLVNCLIDRCFQGVSDNGAVAYTKLVYCLVRHSSTAAFYINNSASTAAEFDNCVVSGSLTKAIYGASGKTITIKNSVISGSTMEGANTDVPLIANSGTITVTNSNIQ